MSDPQINQQALLVSLSFTLCRQSKQSKEEAQRVEGANHAERGTAKVNFFYFQKEVNQDNKIIRQDALFELKSLFGEWRREHDRLTRPWDTGSTRLLPVQLVQAYINMTERFEQKAPEVMAEFFALHPQWSSSAPERMGNLYSAEDFPTLDECRRKIGWSKAMIPLPEAQQWQKISLISPNLAAQMQANTNQAVARAVEECRKQTWKDLIEPIEKIVTTLSKDKPRIFDSLVGNLRDIVELAPAFNSMTNDPDLSRFINETKLTLAEINPDDLRNDPEFRKATCKQAEQLLRKFGNLGERKMIQ